MDRKATDAPSTRPSGAPQRPADADRKVNTLAAPSPAGEHASRLREFAISDDGQLVEAGYGHGV